MKLPELALTPGTCLTHSHCNQGGGKYASTSLPRCECRKRLSHTSHAAAPAQKAPTKVAQCNPVCRKSRAQPAQPFKVLSTTASPAGNSRGEQVRAVRSSPAEWRAGPTVAAAAAAGATSAAAGSRWKPGQGPVVAAQAGGAGPPRCGSTHSLHPRWPCTRADDTASSLLCPARAGRSGPPAPPAQHRNYKGQEVH